MKWRTILLGLGSVLFLLTTLILLVGVNMRRGLNHDEYQFVAGGQLLATTGLLPYRDFPYFHVPGLSLIYAGIFQLSSRLLLSARLFSVLCGWLMVVMIWGITLVELRNERIGVRIAAAVGLVLLLIGSPIFIYTSGRAWNHDLPMLLTVVAFCISFQGRIENPILTAHPPLSGFLPGVSQPIRFNALWVSGRGFQPALIGSGVLLGLAAVTRLSFAFAVLAFILALLAQPKTSWRQRWHGVLNFAGGGVLGALPVLPFVLGAPQAFLFGNLTYIGLNTQYYRSLATPSQSMTLLGKVEFIGNLLQTEPTNLLPLLSLIAAMGLVWRSQHKAPALWRLQTWAILLFCMLLSGLVATPPQAQYFYPLWPLLIVGLALLLGEASQQKQRAAPFPLPIMLLLVTGVVAGVLSRSPYWAGLEIVFLPREWYPNKLHARGQWVNTLVHARNGQSGDVLPGNVLTVAPLIPLEGGVSIYPELATGPFAWRVAPLLSAEERRRYHLFTPEELLARLAVTPPRALLVGLENDDADLEQILVAWAQQQGYSPIALPDEGTLWVSPLAEWGGAIRLGAHTVPQVMQRGEVAEIVFYLQNVQPLPVNLNILVRLIGTDGQEYWRAEGWPWGAATVDWQLGEVWPDGHQLLVPATAPSGCYRVEMSFYNPETFDPLGSAVDVSQLWVSDHPNTASGCL